MQKKPRVFCLSAEAILRSKAAIMRGEANVQPAVKQLCIEADKALATGPFSVMDKALIPPSGDKHDYFSQAIYWWPDPDKNNGLPFIRRDGQINPESLEGTDRKTIDELVSSLEALSLGYFFLDKSAYGEHAMRLLRCWFLEPATRMNPHLRYSQSIPGRFEGRSTGIIDTSTFIHIIDAIGLLQNGAVWTDADQQGMCAWFEAFLTWLLTSKYGKEERRQKNNHGAWYDAQVGSYALFLGKEHLAKRIFQTCKRRRINRQILPDGRQPEALARTRTFHYTLYNLSALFDLASMARTVNIDLWYYTSWTGRSIRNALNFVAAYAAPEKKWPYPEKHFEYSPMIALLRRAATIYEDIAYEQLLEKLPVPEIETRRIQLLYPHQNISGGKRV